VQQWTSLPAQAEQDTLGRFFGSRGLPTAAEANTANAADVLLFRKALLLTWRVIQGAMVSTIFMSEQPPPTAC
jgi:hypothetical protein